MRIVGSVQNLSIEIINENATTASFVVTH